VPYTGVFPIELTLGQAGPMARTAAECALLLEVIAEGPTASILASRLASGPTHRGSV